MKYISLAGNLEIDEIICGGRHFALIWVLFLFLSGFSYINYHIAEGDAFNPAFIASIMFNLFSFFCCLINAYIGIDVNNIETIIIFAVGIGIFTIVNYIFHDSYSDKNRFVKNDIKISSLGACFWGGIIILAMYVEYHFIIDFAASYGVGGGFFEAIVQYKLIMTFHDSDDFLIVAPWYRNYLGTFASCFGYLSAYIYMKEKVIYDRIDAFSLCNVILYFIYSLMGGGRSEAFRVITALLFLWFFFKKIRRGELFSSEKMLLRLAIVMIVISIFFIAFIYIIGRSNDNVDFENIISSFLIYAAAPIFNFDIYIGNPWNSTHGIFGELTFVRFINWLGGKMNDSSLIYELDLPFMSYQNYELGNVFTTFYAFYYDFGMLGVIVLTIVMSICCMMLYRNAVNDTENMYGISLSIIYYSYIVNDIIMLPFSNRFYETFTDIGTIYRALIIYFIVSLMMEKHRMEKEI